MWRKAPPPRRMRNINRIFYSNHYFSFLLENFKRFIFAKLTNRALPVFLKGDDIISINTQILGIHEPVITALIRSYANEGYNGFLLDIGANIGLTSCQNGNDFSECHLFEPNPLCQHILEVNTALTLTKPKVTIHRFTLGIEEKKLH